MPKYPANVFVEYINHSIVRVFGKNRLVRYSLTVDNMDSNSEEYVSVLLMHPSSADYLKSDGLTNQLIRFLSKKDFQEINILSMFPYKAATAEELYAFISEPSTENVMQFNSGIIRKQLKRSSTFILAWGQCPYYIPKMQYDNTIRQFKSIVLEEQCQHKIHMFLYSHASSLTSTDQPEHPYRKYIEDIIPFDVVTLNP